MATGDMQTAAETGGQTKPAYAFQDLSSDPLLSKAPHMEYLGARRPALGGIPLLAKIGQGGMGAVYYGLHPVMGVAVAVKVLPLHLASRNPELARRFVREARIAGSINSANLIYVRDVGEDHGYFYQIMEYVRGVSAGVCLKRLRESGRQGLDEKNALEICIAAAQGLAAAHAKGIIHRDVKPDNILVPVATDERKLLFAAAKLADLGLARMDRGEQPVEATELKESGRRRDESLTVAGAALGTWGYMAAEQANDSRNAGKPADVFSLGATLYALLVGRPPFHGDALMERMLNTILDRKEPVARLRPDVSAATAAVIERCLQKDPAQRYADGAELTTALQECLAAVEAQAPADDVSLNTMSLLAGETVDYTTTAFPEPPAVPPAGQPATLRAGRAVNTVLLVAGVVLAVTGAGLLGFHYWRHAQAEREAKQEAFVAALEHAHEAGRNHAWDSVQPILDKPLAELGMIEDPRRQEAQALIEEANTELKKRADVAAAEEKTRAAAQQKTRAAFTAKMREADGHLANKRWAEAKAAYEEAKGIWPASPDLGAAEAGIGQAQKGAEAAAAEEKTRAAFTTKMKEADGHLANKRWAEAKAAYEEAKRIWPALPDAGTAEAGISQAEKGAREQQYSVAMEEGRGKLGAGDYGGAESAFKHALAVQGRKDDAAAKKGLDDVNAARDKQHQGALAEARQLLAGEKTDAQGNYTDLSDARRLQVEAALEGALKAKPNEATARALKAKLLPKEITLDLGNGVKLELVLIPAGKFLMGSPETEQDRYNDEGPQHEVTITKPFYMGKYEVTQEQYQSVIGKDQSKFKDAKNPVEMVSWDDAQDFCGKASRNAICQIAPQQRTVRLPTEAEWEYACRAGTTTRFSSGDADSALADVAWYGSNSEGKTHPAGQKKPNAWGLYDMHGNVWEWCQDSRGEYAPGAATDPKGEASANWRVLRGSCWSGGPVHCRSARRGGFDPGLRDAFDGFRVVVTAVPFAGTVPPPTPEAQPETANLKPTPPSVPSAPSVVAKEEQARQLFSTVLRECAPLLSQNKFTDAIALLEGKAKDPALADSAALLQQEKADVEAVVELRRQAVEAIRNMVGKAVTLKKGSGTITGKVVDDPKSKGVTLSIGGGEMVIPAEQIHVDDIDHLALVGRVTNQPHEGLRRRGLLFLYAGNVAKAKEYFTQAAALEPETKDQNSGTNRYLDRITALELREVEAAALKAWEKAEKLFAAKDMKGAKAAYEAFAREHGETQTAKVRASTLGERYGTIEKALSTPLLTLKLGVGVEMELVLVKAGEFTMGDDNEGTDDERPAHKVKISKPFYIGKYEVTVAQFRAFADATKFQTDAENLGKGYTFKNGGWDELGGINWRTPGFRSEDNYPACALTWNDAQEFCKWAGKETGRRIYLPTEAQWEYACRAGTTTRYNTGAMDSDLEQAAWYNKNSGTHTNAVGQKKPNAWGLYDMHGNVWEWVQDYFKDTYYQGSPAVDPKGPATGGSRVVRGGSWFGSPDFCRATHRHPFSPGYRHTCLGFRCAVDF